MSLDQFYTKPEVAKSCIDIMDLSQYNTILEPSAGTGSFFSQIPGCMGIDLEPKCEGVEEMDFYDWKEKVDLIIGNPPFGRMSTAAVKFFNHAAKYTDTIAFIIPRTFRKVSLQNRLDMNFHLTSDMEIAMGAFAPDNMMAKCCFQVWERGSPKREKIILPTTHEDFDFVGREDADFAIRGAGSNIGVLHFDFEGFSDNWLFIRIHDVDNLEIFETLPYYPTAGNTVRQDAIGKGDLVYLYTQHKNSHKDVASNEGEE